MVRTYLVRLGHLAMFPARTQEIVTICRAHIKLNIDALRHILKKIVPLISVVYLSSCGWQDYTKVCVDELEASKSDAVRVDIYALAASGRSFYNKLIFQSIKCKDRQLKNVILNDRDIEQLSNTIKLHGNNYRTGIKRLRIRVTIHGTYYSDIGIFRYTVSDINYLRN